MAIPLMHTEGVTDDQEIKTLYVGNLPMEATEPLLIDLFSNLGPVISCKIIRDGISDPYCFIEYADQTSAMTARTAMDGRNLLGKNLKVNWATSSGMITNKTDTSKHFHIFVGDLSPDITTLKLREAFEQYGQISDCRVVKDLQTLKSKGYGFVSYVIKQDAENALTSMNGQWLGSRVIRTNWATRKPVLLQTANKTHIIYAANPNSDEIQNSYSNNYQQQPTYTKKLNYNEVASKTTPTNSTVYCGGIQSGLTDQLIRDHFSKYGEVLDVRVFKDKGYAFIKFLKKDAAVNSIINLTNTVIGGYLVKCSWGKENIDNYQLQNMMDMNFYSDNNSQKMGYMSPYVLASPQVMQQGTNAYQYQQPNMYVAVGNNGSQSMAQNYQYATAADASAYQMQYNNSSTATTNNSNQAAAAANYQQQQQQYAAAMNYPQYWYNAQYQQGMTGTPQQGWTGSAGSQSQQASGGYANNNQTGTTVSAAGASTSTYS